MRLSFMALALAAPTLARSATPAASACTELIRSLPPPLILTPSNASYTAAQYSGFNPLNNVLAPLCIVRPATSMHVASAMGTIHRHAAQYAVRAGGHSGMPGWDGVAAGVLLDLSRMAQFQYDAQAATISVGPGLRWEQIYALAEPYGASVMGARVGHVGTGLLLGGGLSLLSPQYGYACDGVVSVEIVGVDGRIRHVDARSDPDLLRAIKGGGGRFGIVTRYTLRAFPTGTSTDKRWFGGSITILTRSGMDRMVQSTERFVAEAHDDPRATLLSNVGFVKQDGLPQWLGTAYLFYQGTQQKFEHVFAEFLAIEAAVVAVKAMSYYEATQVTPLGWRSDQAYKWIGGSLYPNTSYLSLWSNVTAFLTAHADTLDSAFLSMTPVRSTQIQAGYLAGGNALSPPPGRPYMHWLFSQILAPGTINFPKQLDEDRLKLISENPSSAGLPLLLNESDASQGVFESYGWYEGLKRVYQRVDRCGFAVRYQKGPVF